MFPSERFEVLLEIRGSRVPARVQSEDAVCFEMKRKGHVRSPTRGEAENAER